MPERNPGKEQMSLVKRVLNDPEVHSPKGFGTDIPLYTTKLGETAFNVTTPVALTVYEVGRGLRDAGAELIAFAGQASRERRMFENGYAVELAVPVTLLHGREWPGWAQRVRGAVKAAKENGNFDLMRRMPSGKDSGGQSLTLPVAMTETQQNIMEFLTRGMPVARMVARPDAVELRTRLKAREGDKDAHVAVGLRQERTLADKLLRKNVSSDFDKADEMLLPRVDIAFDVHWFAAKSKQPSDAKINFPLGYMPLGLDETGEITSSPFKVGDRVYHPALLGLRDFADVVTGVISKKTNGIATVDSGTVAESLWHIKSMSEPIGEIVRPHVRRMIAVDQLNKLLAQAPAEVVMAVDNTMVFVTQDNKVHPETPQMMAELTERVLGFKIEGDYPGVWSEFLRAIHQISNKHKASAAWGKGHTVAAAAVYNFAQPNEIYALARSHMGEKEGMLAQILENQRRLRTTSPALLLASTSGPLNILIDVNANLEEQRASIQSARELARRRRDYAATLRVMGTGTTEALSEHLDGLQKAYIEGLKSDLSGKGAEIGKNVAGVVSKRYTNIDSNNR